MDDPQSSTEVTATAPPAPEQGVSEGKNNEKEISTVNAGLESSGLPGPDPRIYRPPVAAGRTRLPSQPRRLRVEPTPASVPVTASSVKNEEATQTQEDDRRYEAIECFAEPQRSPVAPRASLGRLDQFSIPGPHGSKSFRSILTEEGCQPRAYESPYGNIPAQVSAPIPQATQNPPPATQPFRHAEPQLTFPPAVPHYNPQPFASKSQSGFGPSPIDPNGARPYAQNSSTATTISSPDARPGSTEGVNNRPTRRRKRNSPDTGGRTVLRRPRKGGARAVKFVQVGPEEMFEHPPPNPWPVHAAYEEETSAEKGLRQQWSMLRNKRLIEGRGALEMLRYEQEKRRKQDEKAEARMKKRLMHQDGLGGFEKPIPIDDDDDEDDNECGNGAARRYHDRLEIQPIGGIQLAPLKNSSQRSLPPGRLEPLAAFNARFHPSPHPYGHPKHPLFGLANNQQTSSEPRQTYASPDNGAHGEDCLMGYGSQVPFNPSPLASPPKAPTLTRKSIADILHSQLLKTHKPEPHVAQSTQQTAQTEDKTKKAKEKSSAGPMTTTPDPVNDEAADSDDGSSSSSLLPDHRGLFSPI
ncbi:hypothetical protein VTL71DRAFT_9036 [Oculimacula yallundae]|uniref:Uncharacterized protein n=1 Tax=Oculimacula yallundae TaxID=86028 RepID=A0ABR4BTN0_9HELO